VTHFDGNAMRAAWAQVMFPPATLTSERWNGVSVIRHGPEKGLTLYESYEVYRGTLAPTLQVLYGKGLQEAFEAQAVAMKALVEG
jgi:hypothetical protein